MGVGISAFDVSCCGSGRFAAGREVWITGEAAASVADAGCEACSGSTTGICFEMPWLILAGASAWVRTCCAGAALVKSWPVFCSGVLGAIGAGAGVGSLASLGVGPVAVRPVIGISRSGALDASSSTRVVGVCGCDTPAVGCVFCSVAGWSFSGIGTATSTRRSTGDSMDSRCVGSLAGWAVAVDSVGRGIASAFPSGMTAVFRVSDVLALALVALTVRTGGTGATLAATSASPGCCASPVVFCDVTGAGDVESLAAGCADSASTDEASSVSGGCVDWKSPREVVVAERRSSNGITITALCCGATSCDAIASGKDFLLFVSWESPVCVADTVAFSSAGDSKASRKLLKSPVLAAV